MPFREDQTTEKALINVFEEFYSKVYNYFRYHLNNDDEAQDLTGEVFVRVAQAFSRYDRQKAAVSTWVFKIARNLLIDYYRKMKYQTVELQDFLSVEDEFVGSIVEKEQISALKGALQELSYRERELIALKYSAGMKNTEIAAVLGLTVNNVGTIHFRALGKLKSKLKAYTS